jgi:hypothetical protein
VKRLAEEGGETAELLAKLADPAPLGSARTQRILDEIHERVDAPARRPWWPAFAAAAGAAAVLLLVLWPRPAQSPRVTVLAGRAETQNDRVTVTDGRVLVETSGLPAGVDVPAGRVSVRAGSVVEVQVSESRVRVAAYRGSARIDWLQLELTAGRAWPEPEAPKSAEIKAPPAPVAPVVEAPKTTVARPKKAPPPVEAPPPPKPAPVKDEDDDEPMPAIGAPIKTPSALTVEAASLERAVKALRHDGDAATALRLCDAHLQAYPHGILVREAQLTRVEALLRLGRRADALDSLDRVSLANLPRSRQFAVIRGELRAEAHRCPEALRDFAAATDGSDELAERALVGRADCRAQMGDDAGARAELQKYLRRFPDGKFAARARSVSFPAAPPTNE